MLLFCCFFFIFVLLQLASFKVFFLKNIQTYNTLALISIVPYKLLYYLISQLHLLNFAISNCLKWSKEQTLYPRGWAKFLSSDEKSVWNLKDFSFHFSLFGFSPLPPLYRHFHEEWRVQSFRECGSVLSGGKWKNTGEGGKEMEVKQEHRRLFFFFFWKNPFLYSIFSLGVNLCLLDIDCLFWGNVNYVLGWNLKGFLANQLIKERIWGVRFVGYLVVWWSALRGRWG